MSDVKNFFDMLMEGVEEKKAAPVGPCLEDALLQVKKDEISAHMDPEKGIAKKSVKKANARDGKEQFLQEARRIARDLGANGPITMDDVTRKMSETRDIMPKKGSNSNNWKGSVFDTSEWVAIGKIASCLPEAHGRLVTQWALKSWLDAHPMDGGSSSVSAFNFSKINRRAEKAGIKPKTWVIGKIHEDAVKEFGENGGTTLFGIPVKYVEGSGAILM